MRFLILLILSIIPVAAADDKGLLYPGHPLYSLDEVFDELKVKLYELLRILRLVSDDSFAQLLEDVANERRAELSYLEQRGQIGTKSYIEVNRSLNKWLERYEEYTKAKLKVTYEVVGYEIILTVKNVWDREITYVTGGYEARNLETGEKISMKSPLVYPLNLKPGEEKIFRITIPPKYTGKWIVSVEVYTWDGQKLIEDDFEILFPE